MMWPWVLASLDCLWLCHPHAVARAEYKPLQLKALREAGLTVPRTLITNDHAAAVEWARNIGGPVVCKQLSPMALEENGQVRITYTTPVDLSEVDPAALAATAARSVPGVGSRTRGWRRLAIAECGGQR